MKWLDKAHKDSSFKVTPINHDKSRESMTEDDILYFPHDLMRETSQPVFDKSGRRKMFFPFREMRSDEAYLKLTERFKGGTNENPTEALKTKLNWNSKVHSKQKNAIRELSTKTYTDLMASAQMWKVKTKKNPVVIKR